jgi:hypothetical protein
MFQDDISEGNEAKRKMLAQLTVAHMRIMLISHIEREAVSFIEILSQVIKLQKIHLGRNDW